MKWFKNMKIKAQMLLCFALIIVLMAALSVYAVTQINSNTGSFTNVIYYPLKSKESIQLFQNNFRDLRRIMVTLSVYTGEDLQKCETLYAEALATYDACITYLDEFEQIASSNPFLSQEVRDKRISDSKNIRNIVGQYRNDLMEKMIAAARSGDRALSLETIEQSSTIISMIRGGTTAMIESVTEATEGQINDTKDAANTAGILLVVVAIVVAIIAIVIALLLTSSISKPILGLAAFMERAGTTGDIAIGKKEMEEMESFTQAKDEIGQSIVKTVAFLQHVTNISKHLETIAGGDLTSEIGLLSEMDTMGKSLKSMLDNLNRMFGEISASTMQVSTGSKQVADGAQALAQGSTEQASSIQQLSASIADIAQKTKDNADTADRTAKLSNMIKENAEKGSRQMDDMISAVEAINDASKNISKIIKTIDDIAFQTNILALNAAVEAARAGQHGKGFAVVAEEVRNLAAKSAQAAKETGDMIQNSMEKAELGSRIAGETASSLSEIVSGINESSKLIAEIAQASEEQSVGIAQINTGIDQVAQVVQQNSATAQESAAASEEMSGQSGMLEQLISQFRINVDDTVYHSLPADHQPQRPPVKRKVSAESTDYALIGSHASSFGKY